MRYSKTVLKKFILGITALSLTTVCLVSTTFAWFAKNANAWTDQFEVELHINEGLQISVDGENFYDSLDKSQVLKAIALRKYNELHNDNTKLYKDLTEEEINQYSKIVLSPVSPDENYNFHGFYTDSFQAEDIRDFLKDGEFKPVNLTQMGYNNCYVEFDLYFRAIASTNDPRDLYYLRFTQNIDTNLDESYAKSTESTVKLSNSLNIIPDKDLRENPTTKGLYQTGDTIKINPENAVRIATVTDTNENVFEPNEGYGSSAYKNCPTDDLLHNPVVNPMVTYFNNSHNLGNLYLENYENRVITKNTMYGNDLGVFKRADGKYNDIKMRVYIWLDGYDADYLEGVDTKEMHFYLSFTKVGV